MRGEPRICATLVPRPLVLLIVAVLGAAVVGGHGATATSRPEDGVTGRRQAPAVGELTQSNDLELRELDRIGGASTEVAVDGSFAYVSEGPRLLILDVSDPTSPELISRSDDLPYPIQRIDVADGVAVVLAGFAGFSVYCEAWVFDVTHPAAPRIAGKISECCVTEMHLSGDRIFLIVENELLVLEQVGEVPSADWREQGRLVLSDPYELSSAALDVDGGTAYVGTDTGELLTIDVSRPAEMRLLARREVAYGVRDVDVEDGLAYLASGGWQYLELAIYDVHDPARPTMLGSAGTVDLWDIVVLGLDVEGDDAYVVTGAPVDDFELSGSVTGGGALLSFDVSNPRVPRFRSDGQLLTPGSAEGLVVTGSVAYVADGSGGLRLVDVSDAMSPREVGHYDLLGRALDLASAGSMVVVADGVALRVVDASNLEDLSVAGSADTAGFAYKVLLHRDHAIIADGRQPGTFYSSPPPALRVFDLSDPNEPVEVASLEVDGLYGGYGEYGLRDMVLGPGDCLYMTGDELLAIDVSDLLSPVAVEIEPVDRQYVGDVALSGDYLIVSAGRSDGSPVIDVYDVARRCKPRFVSSLVDSSLVDILAGALATDGGYAYAAGPGGLTTISVVDPIAPSVAGSLQHRTFESRDLAVDGGLAYVPADRSRLLVFDVTDPAVPRHLGGAYSLGYGRALQVADGTVYLADGLGGLAVLQFGELPRVGDHKAWLPSAGR